MFIVRNGVLPLHIPIIPARDESFQLHNWRLHTRCSCVHPQGILHAAAWSHLVLYRPVFRGNCALERDERRDGFADSPGSWWNVANAKSSKHRRIGRVMSRYLHLRCSCRPIGMGYVRMLPIITRYVRSCIVRFASQWGMQFCTNCRRNCSNNNARPRILINGRTFGAKSVAGSVYNVWNTSGGAFMTEGHFMVACGRLRILWKCIVRERWRCNSWAKVYYVSAGATHKVNFIWWNSSWCGTRRVRLAVWDSWRGTHGVRLITVGFVVRLSYYQIADLESRGWYEFD